MRRPIALALLAFMVTSVPGCSEQAEPPASTPVPTEAAKPKAAKPAPRNIPSKGMNPNL